MENHLKMGDVPLPPLIPGKNSLKFGATGFAHPHATSSVPIGIFEGSLEVKLPTIWTDGKAEVGRVREEKSRREKIREEKESEERRCRCAKR